MKPIKIKRRNFLGLVAGTAAVGMLAGIGLTREKPPAPERYYQERQARILEDLEPILSHIQTALAAQTGPGEATAILAATRPLCAGLILQLPYIGGDANDLTANLVQSAGALAFYWAMRDYGYDVATTGDILYKGYDAYADATPVLATGFMSILQVSGLAALSAEKDAPVSQQQQYPEDWVFTFVDGEGQDFDWGVDYTECGICKFFHAQGADEFTPYLCRLDYPMSRVFNMGLQRTETLAGGGTRCDFRYKYGRETLAPES
ncbi:MAG: L-2-amino-thiazoline-4-carboxylic acid hydrolase [Anaerolineae bacterium]|nr:L-2-amino-thiazoline-4-carboxylic acid hydrolase [Anaerolineae bacterium]